MFRGFAYVADERGRPEVSETLFWSSLAYVRVL